MVDSRLERLELLDLLGLARGGMLNEGKDVRKVVKLWMPKTPREDDESPPAEQVPAQCNSLLVIASDLRSSPCDAISDVWRKGKVVRV